MLGKAFHPRLQASIYRKSRVAQGFLSPLGIDYGDRFYSSTSCILEDAATSVVDKKQQHLLAKKIRQDYNNRRAAYNREVSKLRKEYAKEVAAQRATDEAAKAKRLSEERRGKLERQRKKNIRAGINLLRQEQLKKAAQVEFEKHLAIEKVKREEREELMRGARQLAIDELETDAHLWLSTPEEVKAAFTPEAIQRLWARPHGVIGSPNPSLDCHFWQMQTHTYKMNKSPKTQRQYLLELVEAKLYERNNLDMTFWTPERIKEVVELEERARLRADVQVIGRRELLKKQAQMIDALCETKSEGIPKVRPPPNLRFLADVNALEKEGAEVLLADPTKFFEFDEYGSTVTSSEEYSTGSYEGPTLGKPIGLKRIGRNKFPVTLMKTPKPGGMSDREKKLAGREQRMLEAARTKMEKEKGIDHIIEDEYMSSNKGPVANFDGYTPAEEAENKEWCKGLDPNNEEDRATLDIPPSLRFSEEDVEWVHAELQRRQEYYDGILFQEVERAQDILKSRAQERSQLEGAKASEESEEGMGLEPILLKMSPKELLELSNLDDAYVLNPEMSNDELSQAAAKIPSLSEEQIKAILQRDRTLQPDDDLGI